MPIKKVYLELTNRCNLNCAICYRKSWHKPTLDMSKEVLTRCLEQIQSISSIEQVVLGGIGEPTIFSGLNEVMQNLKEKHLTITTNGTLMSDALVDTIIETTNHLVVSLDGMNETYQDIRQFSLEHLIKNLNKVIEKKKQKMSKTPYISLQMVISQKNKDDIFDVIDLAGSLGINQVILSNLLPTTKDDKDLILYKMYQNDALKKLFQRVQNQALKRGVELKLPAYQIKTERRCNFIDDDTIMITASGDVVPCYRLAHEGTEYVFGREKEIIPHFFGNIQKDSLDTIWNSPPYTSFRKMVYCNHYPSCIDCDWVDGCDMVRSTAIDCYGTMPSCADCLWSRNIIYCV